MINRQRKEKRILAPFAQLQLLEKKKRRRENEISVNAISGTSRLVSKLSKFKIIKREISSSAGGERCTARAHLLSGNAWRFMKIALQEGESQSQSRRGHILSLPLPLLPFYTLLNIRRPSTRTKTLLRISFMRIQSIIHPVRLFDTPSLSLSSSRLPLSQPSSFLRALHNSPRNTRLASAGKISY